MNHFKHNHDTRHVIVHNHCFKNAGTTIDFALRTNFEQDFVDHRDNKAMQEGPMYLDRYFRNHPNVRALSSHHLALPLPQIQGVVFHLLMMFRHPLERVTSAYHFERAQTLADTLGARFAREHSLRDYVLWRMRPEVPPTIRNFHISRCLPSPVEWRRLFGRSDLEEAKRIVQSLPLVGMVERFDESMVLFEATLRPDFPSIDFACRPQNVRQNRNSSRAERIAWLREEIGQDVFDMLAAGNSLDLELFDFAEALFLERYSRLVKRETLLSSFRSRTKTQRNDFKQGTAMGIKQKFTALSKRLKGKTISRILNSRSSVPKDAAVVATNQEYRKYLEYCIKHPQFFIEISSKCNFRCFYCNSIKSTRKQFMSSKLFYHIIDQLGDITDQPIRLHMDGEPLLHPKFNEFARAINAKGHSIALASNGSLLKRKYLDIDMSILLNFSVSQDEFKKRSRMGYSSYIAILREYIRGWVQQGSRQLITFGIYTSHADRNSSALMQQKYDFANEFLHSCGLGHAEIRDTDSNTLFSHANQGGGLLKVLLYNITSGGLYPETEQPRPENALPKTVGFCDSPWKRFVVLADGSLTYCCLDLSGSLAYTDSEAIWHTPLRSLFHEHADINATRSSFLAAQVCQPTCRVCLDRVPKRVFQAGFQTSFEDFRKRK